jgi:RNA polymerase sporulation-specific sigma factor
MCIERQINTAITKANRVKHKLLNESLSLDDKASDNDKPLIDIIFDSKERDPINYVVLLEEKQELYKKLNEALTPFELEVLTLRLKDFDYKEIAAKLNKSYKSIDSALQRVKNKLRILFNNN